MRKQIILTTIVTLCSFGMIDSAKSIDTKTTLDDLKTEKLIELKKQQATKDSIIEHHNFELEKFLDAIGHRESTNRYDVVNKWGYMGKYQFGKRTLKGLGFEVTRKEFLNNPQLQEEAMMALLLHNKEKLQLYIDTFDGKTINGMLITESGILAAAHLGGQGSVKRYFKNGKVFRDGNGTKITSYMKTFSGYDINLKLQS